MMRKDGQAVYNYVIIYPKVVCVYYFVTESVVRILALKKQIKNENKE